MKSPWPTKKLGEVCEKYFSGIWGEEPTKEGSAFVIRVSDIKEGGIIDYSKIPLRWVDPQKLKKFQLQEGDLLVVKSSGSKTRIISGRTAIFENETSRVFCPSNFLLTLRPNKEKVLPKWLWLYLNSQEAKKFVEKIIGATTYPNIRPVDYLNLEIPLPPLEIQKRIVARIEELFEKIDKAKQLREKALEETEQIFQSALQEVFEKAEKKWGTKKLGEIIELHYGKGIPQKDRKVDGKYPIYGANGELGRTDKYLVEGEAIIIGRKGTAGAINRVSGRFWPADVTYYVFGNKKIDIDFLFYTFKKIDLSQLATGIKPGINRNKVYELQIPLPPLSEQKKIVAYLDNLREKVEKLKQIQQNQLEELTELKTSILEKAFKGELL
jgi:type I restriction enzyme S subunit